MTCIYRSSLRAIPIYRESEAISKYRLLRLLHPERSGFRRSRSFGRNGSKIVIEVK